MNKNYHFYYDPEKAQVKHVYFKDPNENYTYDCFSVFKDMVSGKLYWGQSSGCSCGSPYDEYSKVTELEELNEETIEKFKEEFTEYINDEYLNYSEEEKTEEKAELHHALKVEGFLVLLN